MKAAMRAKEKARLGTIRLILAEFKRIEVDERIEIEDDRAIVVLDKMLKQRRDSATQFSDAGREELADQENLEIGFIQEFLPAQLSEEELIAHCRELIAGYKLPKGITFRTEALPLSGAGKVLKTELRKPFWEGRDRQIN